MEIDLDYKKFLIIEKCVFTALLIVGLYYVGVLLAAYSTLQTEYRTTITTALQKNTEAVRDLQVSIDRLGAREKK